jgi:hypothetical protein
MVNYNVYQALEDGVPTGLASSSMDHLKRMVRGYVKRFFENNPEWGEFQEPSYKTSPDRDGLVAVYPDYGEIELRPLTVVMFK